MHLPQGSRRSTPEPQHSPRVRFSSVPPSSPILTFSVVEWTPASGLQGRLYPKRATSLQRLDNNASVASTEEERRDPRDRVVFETTAGTWSCFRQISCCGDALVLEDAGTIDVGPPRRHEYTWQQGPGRLPSIENGNTSFGASGGWRQTLASVSQSATEMDAEAAKHGTLISRPSHHRREISLQDIHSIRRHVFKRPLPLTFNSNGSLVDAAREESRGGRSKHPHHGSRDDDLENLEWRYELWGPVGVIFMLRGGMKLFLVFASGQHAEQIEELLIDFASGRGLQRRQRQKALAKAASQTPGSQAMTNRSVSAAGNGAGFPESPGIPGSPAVSYPSLRLYSPETSFQGAPGSPSFPTCNSPAVTDAMVHQLPSANAVLSSAASVASTGSPSVGPQRRPRANGSGPDGNGSFTGFLLTPLNTTSASASVSSHPSVSLPTESPSTGYLYCRPWGEATRHRRYYLRLASASPTNTLVRLSRHRLSTWQKIRQTLGHEPRCVSIDLKRTYLTPSATHENIFQVESVVDTYAQYKDVLPLGGAVATAGPGDEAQAPVAARRREAELCRSRPILFEALAKTMQERAEWLAWLQARGATVLRVATTDTAHTDSSARDGPPAPSPKRPSFHPLGHQLFPSSSMVNTSVPDLAPANAVDRWVPNCGIPTTATDTASSVDPLGGSHQLPLPLKESDSERESTSASVRARGPTNAPTRYPQPHPRRTELFPSASPPNASKQSNSSSSPDPVFSTLPSLALEQRGSSNSSPARRHHDGDEPGKNAIVVADGERDEELQAEKVQRQRRQLQELMDLRVEELQQDERQLSSSLRSLMSPLRGEPEMLEQTFKPARRGADTPQKKTDVPQAATAAAHQGRKRVLLRGNHTGNDDGGGDDVSAAEATALASPGEEGATTECTLTGTGPTLVGAARTPMYLEDTSSDDDNACDPAPLPSNTAPSKSPYSTTPLLPSPPEVAQRDADGGGARAKGQMADADKSTPISTKRPASPGSASTVKNTRAPTATPLPSRLTTVISAMDEDAAGQPSISKIRLSQDRQSTRASVSPSPDAPSGAPSAYALLATSPTMPSAETSPVRKVLFSPPKREDDGALTPDRGGHITAKTSSVELPSVPDASSLSSSLRQRKITVITDEEASDPSGFKPGADTLIASPHQVPPESKLDPRLAQFLTPANRTDSDLKGSGVKIISSPLQARLMPLPSVIRFGIRSDRYSSDSSASSPAVKHHSVCDSPLPPPRVGSPTTAGWHHTPLGSRLGVRVPLTHATDHNGDSGTSVQNSASSRATHRDSAYLCGSFPLQSRDEVERRKRAFRDSLFVNQE
ncbi:hypothetical protein ABB37_02911 [Leptomonas pyrrhocoris]|uniref:Uncharacterized protein n=1 Tax=Leptomonas pyrrhocoris TaxID=157538 RepID=A0A0N0DXQ7_LEPPY|nr:hypothetical protein ABB37_02911 [Leptomonas pyrrhocoris]KPA83231.1 hypothetical protein ABB37_02911 [Leptomonas pyrrhocoris]|eukprot:XP_015661670.1 hypothetical protein ABB37_02911 [Leptomonas pyrrhocoris]